MPSSEFWIAGDNWPGLLIQLNTLESNNGWHHYHVVFVSPVGNSVKLKLEDFVGLGGQPGNAYFDNIVLRDSAISAVPEPTSFIVWSLLAIAGVVAYCRHSKGSLTQQESKLS